MMMGMHTKIMEMMQSPAEEKAKEDDRNNGTIRFDRFNPEKYLDQQISLNLGKDSRSMPEQREGKWYSYRSNK